MRRSSVLGIAAIVLALLGCVRDDDTAAVAYVDGDPVTLGELEHYLSTQLLAGSESESPDADRVKSRLLDAMIDERLLVAEAERLGLSIDESIAIPQAQRRRLLVEALERHRVDQAGPAGSGSSPAEPAPGGEAAARGERVSLQVLRFETLEQAGEVEQGLRSGALTFDRAEELHGNQSPTGGPESLPTAHLAPGMREATEALEAGEISAPFESHGEVLIVRLLERTETSGDSEHQTRGAERRRRAREIDALRVLLRNRATIRIVERTLPFRYLPPAPPD